MFKGENYSPVPVTGDALIIVDVQNDFLPKGSLPVPNGDAVVPVLNRYLVEFENRGLPVFNTRDWHLEGVMQEDVICLEDEIMEGSALLHPVMKEGRRLYPPESMRRFRKRVSEELLHLPAGLRDLKTLRIMS